MRVIEKIALMWRSSLAGRLTARVGGYFSDVLEASGLSSVFHSERVQTLNGSSGFSGAFERIFGFFGSFGEKFGAPAAEGSGIVSFLRAVPVRLKALSCRDAGLFAAVFCGVLAAILSLRGGLTLRAKLIFAALVALSVIPMLMPMTVRSLMSSSIIFSRFVKGECPPAEDNTTGAVACGIAAGILAGLLGIKIFAVSAAGIAGLCVLTANPFIGVLACIGAAPFLPTMALAGLIGLTLMCFIINMLFGGGCSFKTDTLGAVIILFGIVLLFFGVTSYTRTESIKIALLEGLFLTSYFLIISLCGSIDRIKRAVRVFSLSSLLCGFYGLYQYLSGAVDMTWVDKELFEDLSLRVYSTFENPNVYGEYLLLALPLSLCMIFISKRLTSRLYYAAVTAVLGANLLLTYARGCYLAVIFACGLLMLFYAKKLLGPGIALMAGGLAAAPFILPASVINRFASITNLADSSTSYRINIWEGTVRLLGDFWPLGIGLGQEAFHTIYPRYSLNAIVAPHAHNLYLQVMTEMGIGGLLTLISIIICFINRCVTAFSRAQWRTRAFIAAMACGICAFLFEGIFEYVWYNYRVFLIFFISIGLTSALCGLTGREGEKCFDN